jgi:two-component system, cell cycle response regulator
LRVLVVESDELSSRILAKKLDNWGHTATVARSLGDARRLIERESFRLIITEINLPDGKGSDLAHYVRSMRRPRYTYITILTDVTDSNILLEALESGADDLLRKPLNVFEMRLRIKAAKRMLNLEDELREGGGTDSTTGLVNSESFRQFFRVIVSENRRTKATGTLLYIHLNNYFDVREASGFQAAEHVMHVVAKALGEIVRGADLVVRLSDDSFCLCLQNTDWPTCKVVGDKVMARLDGIQLVYESHDLRPRVSIEAVNFPDGDTAADALLEDVARFPYPDGEPVKPAAADPRADHSADLAGAEPPPPAPAPRPVAPPATAAAAVGAARAAGDASDMTGLLARAGIDIASFIRLSEFEQKQVLKLAEQLDDAASASD